MNTPRVSPTADSAQILHTVQEALAQHAGQPGNLLPILHTVQNRLGYVPDKAAMLIAQGIQRSRAEVHGVISFYTHFRSQPPAAIRLEICRAESCQACGSQALLEHARQRLGCDLHEISADGLVSLDPVYCLGLCAQSPALMLNGQAHARMTPEKFDALLQTAQA